MKVATGECGCVRVLRALAVCCERGAHIRGVDECVEYFALSHEKLYECPRGMNAGRRWNMMNAKCESKAAAAAWLSH